MRALFKARERIAPELLIGQQCGLVGQRIKQFARFPGNPVRLVARGTRSHVPESLDGSVHIIQVVLTEVVETGFDLRDNPKFGEGASLHGVNINQPCLLHLRKNGWHLNWRRTALELLIRPPGDWTLTL